MRFDKTDYSPAFFNVAVKGEHDDEPRVFQPLAHNSGEAISRVIAYLDQTGVVLVGRFQFEVYPARQAGGYDSPMIATQMRLGMDIHTKPTKQ